MEMFMQPETWLSLLTLTFMEIVLGVDNIIFISIVADKLPQEKQGKARNLGLLLALFMRIGLLVSIKWIIGLKKPIFSLHELPLGLGDFELTWKGLILIIGGLFLLYKSVSEMHHKLEGEDESLENPKVRSFGGVILQIVLLDIVFSLDSILTAVGLADDIIIMIIAVVIALIIMMTFAKRIADFINERPTMKMLALSFLLLIGFTLILEGLEQHINKGYIYFAIFFSLGVEVLNNRLRDKEGVEPVQLREKMRDDGD